MFQMIIGLLCILAVIFIRDEPRSPQRRRQQPDPWVILALEEDDEAR